MLLENNILCLSNSICIVGDTDISSASENLADGEKKEEIGVVEGKFMYGFSNYSINIGWNYSSVNSIRALLLGWACVPVWTLFL